MFRVLLSVLLISVLAFAPAVAQETETDPNILAVEHLLDQFNTGDYDVGLFTADFVLHHPPSMNMPALDREATIAWMRGVHQTSPDMIATATRMIHEGDFVTLQYDLTYTDNAGQMQTVPGMDLYRVENGQLAEAWMLYDTQLMNQQSVMETNKALVAAFLDAHMHRDFEMIDTLIADDFTWHSTASPDLLINSSDAFMQHLEGMVELFSAACNRVLLMSAEDNYVIVYGRFVGELTDEQCTMDITAPVMLLFRIENGKIAEEWVDWEHIPFTSEAELWSIPDETTS
jgi:predicted SnoaL-like aldol condensation-catalyzing enzyme